VQEQKNANEDVEPHGHIDGGDVLNLTYYYNLLPPIFSSGEDGWSFFWSKFVIAIPFLSMVLKPLLHFPFPCEKVNGAFFLV
jgi:hypothetical protein